MFAATITPTALEDAFKPVNALVDECKVRVDDGGLTVTAVDPANVGMVDLELPDSAFETYEADEHTLGLPLERFIDIVSLFTKQDSVARIKLNEESRTLRMDCGGLDYTLSLIDPDSIRKEPKVPDLNVTAEVTITGHDFSRAVNACNMVADHLRIGSDAVGEFYVEAEGDTDTVDVTMGEDDVLEIDPGDAQSLFSIEYLRDMERSIPDDTPVTLELGPDFPVLIHFKAIEEQASLRYVLAPRITND